MGHPANHAITDPAEFWETRYNTNRGENGHMWSGRVNPAVEHETTALSPGTALDLGCGEGADTLWLAAHGWTVTAIDISATAFWKPIPQYMCAVVSDRDTCASGTGNGR
ncbi:methyltransferase domain-containing protein [Paeniglutamicibacter sp. ZC-3]|uniref:class I SAM-dependent methyltransferase n=1 Tax=Paeniglutamicibacter sp. ZC-3 TaxID=2986919 RepID=UPI0021F76DF6|nr:methyltransferase domain-containing protein [Paeniglutamicibacter sp. ZC-3]MCV9996535.1 methyltransferase domain-containing protein [Paeniglutamicibacter sp. ZC-3]